MTLLTEVDVQVKVTLFTLHVCGTRYTKQARKRERERERERETKEKSFSHVILGQSWTHSMSKMFNDTERVAVARVT